GENALLATRDTLALHPDFPLWVDARAFDHAATRPELDALQKAATLYKGDFMTGFTLRDAPAFDEWQFFEADRLRRLYAATLERLISSLTARGDHPQALEHARAWLALDPLHEPAHRTLMRLYAQTGQRAAALRQYRECIRILEAELGVAPLEETRQLYEEILEGKGEEGQRREGEKEKSSKGEKEIPLFSPAPFLPGSPPPFPLTGRTSELTILLHTYAQVAPDGYFISLEGEAGIGKSRLVEEFIAQVQTRGAISVVARCYRGEEQLAYAPFLDGLRQLLGRPDMANRLSTLPARSLTEVGRLFPELGTYVPPVITPGVTVPSSQLRLFESLRQILLELVTPRTASHPGLLFLDDLQWADSASLELLSYLVRRLTDFPLLIIAAWRKEGETHRLENILSESLRAGLGMKMTLGRLTPGEMADLATGVLASEHLPTLYQETEGLPFFIVEYLTAARQNRDWLPSVQNLERARLSGLNDTARQVLTTAAVIGRSFDFPTLRETSGRSEDETITGLEALLARGLLVEHAPANHPLAAHVPSLTRHPSYDFTHEKIRTVVYEDTSLARRRLLHRRVAEVLINEPRTHDENAARIASHFQLAGQEPEAAHWYFRAGDHARKLYANAEGIAHYQTALALGHPDPRALHEALGDLQTLQGDYRAASASYETAAALANPTALPPLEHKLANLHHRRGDYSLAASFFQSALVDTPPNDFLHAHLLADWSRTCAQQGDLPRARQLAEDALSCSDACGTPGQAEYFQVQAQAHNVLGMIARQTEDLPRAAHHLQQALDMAEKANHLPAQIAARNNLALVYADQENYPRALELTQAALDMCTRLGDRHREAALRNRLADLSHASHQPSAALYHLKKAVEIFAEIGGQPGAYEPEIWKLTEW
ncbi:MAG TPA: AAA family ATPase, partial [Anaerolineales bacterium]|nr:AAA family ATPase [Anaerolineales bacterium]